MTTVLNDTRARLLSEYDGVVDAVLPLFGRGTVLDLGAAEHQAIAAWRRRGSTVTPFDVTQWDGGPLPFEPAAFEAVAAFHVFDDLSADDVARALAECSRVAHRFLFVRVSTRERSRDWWEQQLFAAGFAKHPLGQWVAPYDRSESAWPEIMIACERVPAGAANRLPDSDPLRTSGRDADAEIARHNWAAQFVRMRDRVLVVSAARGHGAAILHDATLADAVTAICDDDDEVADATVMYGARRSRLTFRRGDASSVSTMPDGSVDVVVAFDTLNDVGVPSQFVTDVARVLTPAGRFVCALPNRRPRFRVLALQALLGDGFLLEQLSTDIGDWSLVVAMRTPYAATTVPFRESQSSDPDAAEWTVTAFERYYDNPWLIRALIAQGQRASSRQARRTIAYDVLRRARIESADRGAALCVLAYAALDSSEPAHDAGLARQLVEFCALPPSRNPHVERWRISNEYVLAKLCLRDGFAAEAEAQFAACAARDCRTFSPLLGTKTVDAAFWAGWLAFDRGDVATARRQWTRGLSIARDAARSDWTGVIGSMEQPLLFGMRELTQVLDCASRCANALHLIDMAADRAGHLRSSAFYSLGTEVDRRGRALARAARQSADSARLVAESTAEIHRLLDVSARAQRAVDALEVQREQSRRRERRLAAAQFEKALHDPRGIAVFGAGEGGRRFAAQWLDAGGRVACYSDNRVSTWGTQIGSAPVVSPAELARTPLAAVVIASTTGRDEIAAQLDDIGLPSSVGVVFAEDFRG